jgi:mannitol-specific phosphotransferase system IIBC component
MKKTPVLLLIGFLTSIASMQSQELKTEREIRRQEAKVDTVYTVQERANMELWFYERVNEMGLSDEIRDQYDTIVFSYIYQMSRLNDKDKDYSIEEIHVKFDAIVDNMNAELKQLLTTEQYINHLENFNQIVRSIYHKYGWED